MSVLITHAVMVDRVLTVSTVTPATASQDLVETGVRQVCLLFVINNLYYLIDYFFDFFFDLLWLCFICFVLVCVCRIALKQNISAYKKNIYVIKHFFVFYVTVFKKV